MGTHHFYKGKYFIVFYDDDDETFRYMFNNVREILKFKNKKFSTENARLVNVELYRALKSETHFTRLLNGELMRVYIVNMEDEDNE